MLKKIASAKNTSGGKFAIIAAKYNPRYVDALVKSARAELKNAGENQIDLFRVPGSFEVPAVAAKLASRPDYDAIICFGVILRGATTHAQQIADAVSFALAQIQVNTGKPVIHGVLLFENEEQAKVRCFGTEHNRGIEAARVALEMGALMKKIDSGSGR
jgi:6,7-dimethyl-8-ribityllumazine synthase